MDADLARNVLGYAAVQTGYLPGGYTPLPNSPTFNNNVDPEKLLSYTVGVKSRFLNDRLTLNDEAYYYIYKNYQVVAISLVTGFQTVYNAPRSIIYGDQVNAVYRLTDHDTINLGVNFMSAHFTELNVGGEDLNGYQLANAPVMAGTGGYEHHADLSDGSDVSFRVQSHVQAGYWGVYDHPAGTRRGTVFDPFGHTAERKMERRLITEYEDLVKHMIQTLRSERLDLAVELARLPDGIRGFGHVKDRHVAAVKKRETELREQWDRGRTEATPT